MRKKLLTVMMLGMLMLAGCSEAKSAKNEQNTVEKDPYEAFYGTWRTSGIYSDGTRYTIEQLRIYDADDAVDFIMIINEKGTGYIYVPTTEEKLEVIWKTGDDQKSIAFGDLALRMEDGELVYTDEEEKLYLAKVSSRQDKDIIEEIISNDQAQEDVPEETIKETIEPVEEEPIEEIVSENAIRPEIKEAIDAYEEFIDEYIAFMEKYEESDGSDPGILMEYMTFISDLEEYLEEMDALEKDLTDAESWYFLEVMNRCNEKLYKAGN